MDCCRDCEFVGLPEVCETFCNESEAIRHLKLNEAYNCTDKAIENKIKQSPQVLRFRYKNWQGIERDRKVIPTGKLVFTSTEYHPEQQWLLECIDIEDNHKVKLFALRDILEFYK